MTPETLKDKEEQDELERQAKAIYSLSQTESYQLWRDRIVKPELALLETLLEKAETLSEVEVRATLKTVTFIKKNFYWVFENIKDSFEIDKQINKE